MYLFKNIGNDTIDIYKVSINEEKLRELKAVEVVRPLDYKTIYRATTNKSDKNTLLNGNEMYDFYSIHDGIKPSNISRIRSTYYHNVYPVVKSDEEVFTYLNRLINNPVTKCVIVKDFVGVESYLALTNPVYEYNPIADDCVGEPNEYTNHRMMEGIVPVTNEFYILNEIASSVYDNNYAKILAMAEEIKSYKEILNIELYKTVDYAYMEELYDFSMQISNSHKEFLNYIDDSAEILKLIK